MNQYELKLEAKRERLLNAADRAEAHADAASSQFHSMLDIMNGTPVLVGHHSEGRHRRDLNRVDTLLHKAVQGREDAEELRRRAASVGEAGISSDDPDAPTKLQAKLAALEAERERMTRINKLFRKNDAAGLAAEGLDLDSLKAKASTQYSWEKAPFAPYQLQNLGGRIRQVKERITQLESATSRPEAPDMLIGEWTIHEDKLDNRILLSSPTKPPEAQRKALKASGFRWSPTRTAWVRQISNGARYDAERILKGFVA